MEPNETNAALNQTVAQLRGGVVRVGIGAAIPAVASWEQTLRVTGRPELAPVVENLSVLRNLLASANFDPAEVSRVLALLADQVRIVAASPIGLPIAAPLTQLSLLLNTGASNIASQAALSTFSYQQEQKADG